MDQPIEVELPHRLGKEEARRRIAGNMHKLRDQIPGGATHMDSSWAGDELSFNLSALGQTVAAQIGVEETKVRLRVMLPPMLAMFAGPIEAALTRKGSDLLLEDRRKD
jgi:putative polyhydroxyalkanoic acid system protein